MSKVVFCNKRVIFFGQFTIKICLFKAASKEYCMYIILRVLLTPLCKPLTVVPEILFVPPPPTQKKYKINNNNNNNNNK